MKCFFDTFETPLGSFSVAIDESGAVVGSAFGDVTALESRVQDDTFLPDSKRTAVVRCQIQEYFARERQDFDVLLAPRGSAFQKQVWAALHSIPFGHTWSYAQLAAAIGRPRAVRAVGRANATNPICLLAPCHRVIGSNGSLTGFAFGLEFKRWLLAHEQSHSSAHP